jgi:protein SCO1/2
METDTPTSTAAIHDRQPGWRFWLMMFGSLAFVGGLAFLQYMRTERVGRGRASTLVPDPLPVLATVPDVAFTERSGQKLTLSDLHGRVWAADFIFTYCAGQCPVITRRMGELRRALDEAGLHDVLCVSFSVDPERDSPKALAEYADAHKADAKRWLFLTGDRDETYQMVRKGFLQPVEPETDTDQILHSFKFFLVDKQGRMRAYYDVMTDDEQAASTADILDEPMPGAAKQKIVEDARRLLSETVR